MSTYIITKVPVGVNCDAKKPAVVGALAAAPRGPEGCRGVMSRVTLSRLEEGLGHEGFECDKCHRKVKYVPPK